ncbi:MAG TPA: oxidoreductase, partial [Ruminococcaceae bacterium]|nr:oxidoreductase [Oscillospiraceae bacterium]
MVRLATVGTSAITEKFLSAARKTGRFELVTCYSRTGEKGEAFAKAQGFKGCCTDISELAKNPDINAVYIATPNSLHYAQSRIFLENGKHVLCEKPITASAKEYDALLKLADEKGVIYAEAIMSRHFKGRKILFNAL